MEFVGFHGTDSANENSIFQLNFTVSAKSDEWLGTGAYFFLDGVGDPTEHADSWAKLHAYDRDSRSLSLIHISEPTRLHKVSRMPSSA